MTFEDNSLSIGRTPLIRLNRITNGAPVTLLAKIEGRNPAYSVKDRIGASMIWDAEPPACISAEVWAIQTAESKTVRNKMMVLFM